MPIMQIDAVKGLERTLSRNPLIEEHYHAVKTAANRGEPFFLNSPRLAIGEKFTLRRHQAAKEKVETESKGSREFKHQWMVCGHHRNQWYPSLKANKMIWISPYLKGPEDKPMIVKTYKVAR